MKNLTKFAFVALTALAVTFTSCQSTETKTEGTTDSMSEGTEMSTDSTAMDPMAPMDSASTTAPAQ